MADRHIYDPGAIEPKWQDHWDREGVFKAVEDDDNERLLRRFRDRLDM